MTRVPCKGGGPASAAILGNEVVYNPFVMRAFPREDGTPGRAIVGIAS
jgi:hypothetical protein